MNPFRIAQSTASDTRTAAQEFYARVIQDDPSLVLFFCSNAYDLAILAEEINHRFAGIPVIGCTSSGGFGPQAYGQAVLSGVSFARTACQVACAYSDQLQTFDASHAHELTEHLYSGLDLQVPGFATDNCVAFQLIDGLSKREEVVTRVLQGALGHIPLVGGSAGDDMCFNQTRVFCEGEFRSAVAVALIHTELPVFSFMTQHFVPTDDRLVVTEADSDRRIVSELNGFPAAEAYARCLGVEVQALNSALFAEYPVLVTIGSKHYVRSIQRVLPDGNLAFYCAIEEGVVLRVARNTDLLQNLSDMFVDIRSRVGTPGLVLGCECVLRKLEAERLGMAAAVQDLLATNHALGFCTYGEQYRGVHINQTLTGIAFGLASESGR
jgi:hypothetical protein